MMREKIIGRWNFIKIKNAFSVKDNVKSIRNQGTVRKNIFSNSTSDSYSKHTMNQKNSMIIKLITQFNKWVKKKPE